MKTKEMRQKADRYSFTEECDFRRPWRAPPPWPNSAFWAVCKKLFNGDASGFRPRVWYLWGGTLVAAFRDLWGRDVSAGGKREGGRVSVLWYLQCKCCCCF